MSRPRKDAGTGKGGAASGSGKFFSPIKLDGSSRGGGSDSAGAPSGPIRVTARLEQPVQSYRLEPFVFARDAHGAMVSLPLKFEWRRSKAYRPCAYLLCQKFEGPMPKTQTAPSAVPGSVQCSSGKLAKLPPAMSFFCSTRCMEKGWPMLRRCLMQRGNMPLARVRGDELRAAAGAISGTPAEEALLEGSSEESLSVDRGTEPLNPAADGWEVVSSENFYIPGEDDVWHWLQVEITYAVEGAAKSTVVNTKHVLPTPISPICRLYRTPGKRGSPTTRERLMVSNPNGIRIVTYNVLAEIYATQGAYPYCPSWALSFSYRSQLLLQELRSFDADILCLQEVQEDHYNSLLKPRMKELGYTGLYKKKTRPPMGIEGKVDGCALFYRSSRFSVEEKYVIEFNDAALAMQKAEKEKNKKKAHHLQTPPEQLERMVGRLMRDNVAQVMLLSMRTDSRGVALPAPVKFCVANTHLFWDPGFADVKLWQTHMLVKELEKYAMKQDVPVFLCGDFNSEVDSAVHKFLGNNFKEGQRRVVLAEKDLPADPESIIATRERLAHQLLLASAYERLAGSDPLFTNYTKDFKGCLDYCWFTADRLQLLGGLIVPSAHALEGETGTPLPNPMYPSDHVALVFDFKLEAPAMPMPSLGGRSGGSGGGSGSLHHSPPLAGASADIMRTRSLPSAPHPPAGGHPYMQVSSGMAGVPGPYGVRPGSVGGWQ